MQRDSERRTAGDVEHHDELAERRRRRPRPPGSAALPGVLEDDQRRRPLAAAAVGRAHAELVEHLTANPDKMATLLDDVWRASDRDPVSSPWEALGGALAACRAQLRDRNEIECFDDVVAQLGAWLPGENDCFRDLRAQERLTREQHFVFIASAFARNDVIADYLSKVLARAVSVEAVRKHQERVRKLGLGAERAAEQLAFFVERRVERAGIDVMKLREAFLHDDGAPSLEALDAYDCRLVEIMLAGLRSDV